MTSSDQMPVCAIDLFCGVGGLSFGMQRSGVQVKAGIDLDPNCKFAYEANCKVSFINQDVSAIDAGQLRNLFGDAEVRVLAGCAPCQPFSTYAQSRKSNDNRWELLNSFRDLTTSLRPEIVTMENVERLALTTVWKRFVHELEACGYHTSWDFVRCDELGLPQRRKRLVFVGSLRPGLCISEIPRRKTKRTVRQAISKLPPVAAGKSTANDPLHLASRLSDLNLRRIRSSRPGGTWRDWDYSLRSACHQKGPFAICVG
jgi:DNA (cytosine-5)-methyltransferase 1